MTVFGYDALGDIVLFGVLMIIVVPVQKQNNIRVLFDGAARSKTCEQRAAAVRGRALQRQPRHERQIPARERAAEQRAAVKAAGFGEVFGLGPGKVRAVLIAQRAQQKQRIVPRAAGGVRTVARLAHAADEPLAVQPRQIRRGPAGHVFKRVGD